MSKNKKTFNLSLFIKLGKKSHNKNATIGKNKDMIKNKKENNCKIHVMPPTISDEDISALFNGILNVVKKKFELEVQAEFINMNTNINKLKAELKEKTAECVRLKNEILNLKAKLEN